MPKRPTPPAISALPLDRTGAGPLYRQLYAGLRQMILAGQLPAGTRLPSTRVLAGQLELARSTVQNAFEQLLAEGYLVGKAGSGTFVADVRPDEAGKVPRAPARTTSKRTAAEKSQDLINALRPMWTRPAVSGNAFRVGLPALDAFPHAAWGRLLNRAWRNIRPDQLRYQCPAGYRPLREAIAAHIGPARGVRCTLEQVMITAGSQQALDLAARCLLNPGEQVWVEDPGYLGARGALLSAGAAVVPVPVDSQGLDPAAGEALAPRARMAYVSPSHQFPLGATLSLARRLALLDWAGRNGAWILEDDYDSEYRFSGRPLAALQSLDAQGRVIYIGTFSKTLFPGLRLGYLVVPDDLVEVFSAARFAADRHSPAVEQAALAGFIGEGHFARHIRRMRALYGERQRRLLEAAEHELGERLRLQPAETGMHLVGWLAPGVDDTALARRAAAHGVEVSPLSWYTLRPPGRPGLLLGYGGTGDAEIRAGVRRLRRAFDAGGGSGR